MFVANSECSLGMILVLLVVDAHVVIDSALLLNHITSDLRKGDGSIFNDLFFIVFKCAIRVSRDRGEERVLGMRRY